MKRIALLVFLGIVFPILIVGCTHGKPTQQQVEQKYTQNQQSLIDSAEPFPILKDSAARKIQNYYYTAEADPNKIWYLTLLSLDGSPIGTFTIRGPVENQADQVTNPDQLTCNYVPRNNENACGVIGLAEPNGVYQPPTGNDHIAILTTGAQVRFDNYYIVSDQPLRLTTPVKLSVNESAPVSSTDTTKSQGGLVPSKR